MKKLFGIVVLGFVDCWDAFKQPRLKFSIDEIIDVRIKILIAMPGSIPRHFKRIIKLLQ